MNKVLNCLRVFFASILFNIFLISWSLVYGVLCFIPALFSKKLTFKIAYIWVTSNIYVLRFLCGIKYTVTGIENIPKDCAIIAAKHESAWDTFFLYMLLKNPAFVLKRELLFIPIFGIYLIITQMIYINRKQGKSALQKITTQTKYITKEKRKIIIFPQGTRTLPYQKAPYKSGIYIIAKTLKVPVIPVALNSAKCWRKNSFFKFPGTIEVKILPAINFNKDKKKFIKSLEIEIESAYKDLNFN